MSCEYLINACAMCFIGETDKCSGARMAMPGAPDKWHEPSDIIPYNNELKAFVVDREKPDAWTIADDWMRLFDSLRYASPDNEPLDDYEQGWNNALTVVLQKCRNRVAKDEAEQTG